MVLFTFRNLSPRKLLIAAGIFLMLMLARENRDLYKEKTMISRGEAIAAIDTSPVKISPKQKSQLSAMNDFKERNLLEKKKARMEVNVRNVGQSNYEDLYETRTSRYLDQLVQYVFFELWDVLLFMFLGMAFFKMGILTGQANTKLYLCMFVIGLGAGIFLSYVRLQPYIHYNFNYYEIAKHINIQYYQLERMLRSLGLFGAIMLMYKSGLFKWLFALMRPVGQMAFTNYLMQSLLCGIFFLQCWLWYVWKTSTA
jgi:uncharacterized protein